MMNFLLIFRWRCSCVSAKHVLLLVMLLLYWPMFSSNPISSSASSYSGLVDPRTTLDCLLREYNYKVIRSDSLGRKCWDYVRALSCWGRCDTNEIADWQFPFKISHHPVCIHDQRVLRQMTLSNCEAGVEAGTATYEYYDAVTCSCRSCKSSSSNCEGLRHYSRQRQSHQVK